MTPGGWAALVAMSMLARRGGRGDVISGLPRGRRSKHQPHQGARERARRLRQQNGEGSRKETA